MNSFLHSGIPLERCHSITEVGWGEVMQKYMTYLPREAEMVELSRMVNAGLQSLGRDVVLPRDMANVWPRWAEKDARGDQKRMRELLVRAIFWTEKVWKYPLVQRFLKKNLTNAGTEVHDMNLWNLIRKHGSPRSFSRWLERVLEGANKICAPFGIRVTADVLRRGVFEGRPHKAARWYAVAALNTHLARCGGAKLERLVQFRGVTQLVHEGDRTKTAWCSLMVRIKKFPDLKAAAAAYVTPTGKHPEEVLRYLSQHHRYWWTHFAHDRSIAFWILQEGDPNGFFWVHRGGGVQRIRKIWKDYKTYWE